MSQVAPQAAIPSATPTTDPATEVLTATCPECGSTITFARAPRRHELVRCPDCGAELEVTGVSPITLALAPEVEEDWGE
ncbi:MAG: lysine biosynthesis protein LysW [Phycisphaerales bacterium]|jgi:alpha-aminoadipate carrier protein LysW